MKMNCRDFLKFIIAMFGPQMLVVDAIKRLDAGRALASGVLEIHRKEFTLRRDLFGDSYLEFKK